MIKKITALITAIALLCSVSAYAADFSDVALLDDETKEAVGVLSELGVLSGMGDGTFSPYTSLTRAQFAKIAVCIMGKTDEAVVTTSAFSDVDSNDWYSGYVNVVAAEGIITGYPDGSFGANDKVTYAQAITVLIRLLGYNSDDVGHKWPQGYIDKANVLKLTENISFNSNDVITRDKAALVIYRALFTDVKDAKTALVTKMDKNVYEDSIVVATKSQNTALLSNQVQSDKGTFTYDKNVVDIESFVGYEGTLVVNDDSEVIAFVPSADITNEEYTVSAVYSEGSGNGVSLITSSNATVTLNNKTVVYLGGGTYTAEKLAEGLNPGSTVSIFYENGAVKYAFVDEYKYQGPEVVLSKSTVDRLFNITDKSTLKVIRKGLSATVEDIEIYDVLYYSERTNTLYAYADKVTGVYEEAYPMKSNVSKVTVSGKEYTLSSIDAVNKLNESENAYNIGDRVTLLLGEDGLVCDVVNLTDADVSVYGVVTGTSSEVSTDTDTKGRTEYYVNIVMADGTEAKYLVADDRYENKAGRFCEVNFNDSYAVLSFPSTLAKAGVADKDEKTFGDYEFASDYAIMEYVSGDETRATVTTLTLADIDSLKLVKNQVKHIQLNQKGEIVVLYLNNASGNNAIYGIIIEEPDSETGAGSHVLLSGNTKYTVAGYNSYKRGDCVAYNQYDGTLKHLAKIATGVSITGYTDNIIKLNGRSYTVSDDVEVYAGEYLTELKTVSLDDAVEMSGSVVLYSDRSVAEGGKIRVIRIIASN